MCFKVQLFTIGYTKKSAEKFFELISTNQIEILVDVRLYNSTQLAGFSKSRDLKYFLKIICNCDYIAAPEFAPTARLFNDYKSGNINWKEYEVTYNELIRTHMNLDFFRAFPNKRICLLCAEDTPECCHRRLLAEKIASIYDDVTITHL